MRISQEININYLIKLLEGFNDSNRNLLNKELLESFSGYNILTIVLGMKYQDIPCPRPRPPHIFGLGGARTFRPKKSEKKTGKIHRDFSTISSLNAYFFVLKCLKELTYFGLEVSLVYVVLKKFEVLEKY